MAEALAEESALQRHLVLIPGQLRGYVDGRDRVSAAGATLDALFDDLDRQFPGLRFRVIDEQDRLRRHMLLFVGDERQDDLRAPLPPGATVMVVGALSGG
jgi:molybdopterin synthase sulfur carrier subunit